MICIMGLQCVQRDIYDPYHRSAMCAEKGVICNIGLQCVQRDR